MVNRLEIWYHTLVSIDFETGQVHLLKSYATNPNDKSKKMSEKLETKQQGVITI